MKAEKERTVIAEQLFGRAGPRRFRLVDLHLRVLARLAVRQVLLVPHNGAAGAARLRQPPLRRCEPPETRTAWRGCRRQAGWSASWRGPRSCESWQQ
jgi:hypothetical protein